MRNASHGGYRSQVESIARVLGKGADATFANRFARNSDALLASARENRANLIIVDLHAQKIDPIALATALKSDPELQAIVLLGFFSHVQTDLMREATKAGYDRVMPRSAFSKDLATILAG